MSTHSPETIVAAHKHSSLHKEELLRSSVCGCFYCLKTYPPTSIEEWVDEDNTKGPTALCPICGIDSVIGSASGYPVTDIEFLQAMYNYWF